MLIFISIHVDMANMHRNFPSTILIGFALLALLFSNNAKTIAARFVPSTTPQPNEHSLKSPTCVKLGCNKNQQNNLNPSLSHKVDHFLQPSNVNRIFRLSPGGPNSHHH